MNGTTRPDMPLHGQVALVTGAGRGLGHAYAMRLSQLGATLAVTDIDLTSFRDFTREEAMMSSTSTADAIANSGAEVSEYELDVTDGDSAATVVDAVSSRYGRIDILVCNAGGGSGSLPESAASILNPRDLDAVFQRNFFGTVNTVRPVAATMKRQGSGKIITVASVAGKRASADGTYSHYGAAKSAISMYTRYLARDLGPFGVTANCLVPGMIGTGRMMERFEQAGVGTITAGIPLGRLGTVDDVAKVVEFLATDLSDYVSGAEITVDGGFLA